MDVVRWLEGFLFQIASGLYAPVVVLVSALAVYTTWAFGSFLADAALRWRRGSADQAAFAVALESEQQAGGADVEARVEKLLRLHEIRAAARLDRVRFIIKVGPALGLMGTLIPMGVSLASLAEGNIPKMAGSMVTAFTATVAGLACGVLAYVIALLREKWVRTDLLEMEYLAETRMNQVAKPGQMERRHALSEAPAAA